MERKLHILKWALATYFLGYLNLVGSKPLSKMNLSSTTGSPSVDEIVHSAIFWSNSSENVHSSDAVLNVTRINNKFSGPLYPNLYEHEMAVGEISENSFPPTISSEKITEMNTRPNLVLDQDGGISNSVDDPNDNILVSDGSSHSSTSELAATSQSFNLDSSQSNASSFTMSSSDIPSNTATITPLNSVSSTETLSTTGMPTRNITLQADDSNDTSEQSTSVTIPQSENNDVYTENIYSTSSASDLQEISKVAVEPTNEKEVDIAILIPEKVTESDVSISTTASKSIGGEDVTFTTSVLLEKSTETNDGITTAVTKSTNEEGADITTSATDQTTETISGIAATTTKLATVDVSIPTSEKWTKTNSGIPTSESTNGKDNTTPKYVAVEITTGIVPTTEKSTTVGYIMTSSVESLSETDATTLTHDDTVRVSAITTLSSLSVSTDITELESSLTSVTTEIDSTSDSKDNSTEDVYSPTDFFTDAVSAETATSKPPNGLNTPSDDDSICSVCKSCTNSYVDRVISDVTAGLPSFLELPNRQGRFQLYHGKLFGLETLERSDETEVTCDSNDTYSVMVPLRLNNTKAFYKWQMEMPLRTFYGDINVTAATAESRVFYLHSKGISVVEGLRITALNGIRTEFSGLGPFNSFFSGLIRFTIAVFRRSFTRAMENALVAAINKELQDVRKYEEYYAIKE